MQDIDIKLPVRFRGRLYMQSPEGQPVGKGDMVLDLGDFTVGEVDLLHSDTHIAIRDKWFVEVGIPITRVRRLIEFDQ